MLVIARFRVPVTEAATFLDQARRVLEVFAERPGHRSGWVGRATDDAQLWTITTVWEGVGAYRRALSAYDVKLHVVPVLSYALDEPTAYEVLLGEGSDGTSSLAADSGDVALGYAAAPTVPTDLERSNPRPD